MILIGDREWLWPAAAIAALALVVLWWSYRRLAAPRRLRIACASLKAAAFVLLAVFLFEPLWSGVRARPGANLFLVVADNSRSLEIRDADAPQTRGESLQAFLSDRTAPWQVRLEQDFDVRRYRFDAGLSPVDDFTELDFTGTASHQHAALQTLAERFRGRPVAGVLLFSDGNATDAATLHSADLPPVYAVPIGAAKPQPDVAIGRVAVTQTAFEDAPVTVHADVTVTGPGLDAEPIVARVLDEDGQIIAESTQSAPPGTEPRSIPFRFQLRPTRPGVSFYTLEAAPHTDAEPPHAPPPPEATLENNRRTFRIDRGAGRQRILYVSGRPNWEFKFLRRSIEDDPGLELAALIRIAKREAKFEFRGRAGESSNPLFRGFKPGADADTESHDEPVLVRLNIRDADELRGGFPNSARELFRFHAVILDDLEAAFFTPDQWKLLEQFVSERGGGLLMLGGQESFARGGYEHTPVARLLPVYLDRVPVRAAGSYRMRLSRDGWLQPWTRLRATEADERQRLEEMPAFRTLNPTSGVKPGATVLAEALDQTGNTHPALIAHRYGHGRAAALTIGDLWRWRLRQHPDNDDLGKAWRQTLRWLVADVPEPVTVDVLPLAEASHGAVRLRVQALDAEFQPRDNAAVLLTVHPPRGEPITLPAEPSLTEPGVFVADYVVRHAGPCRVVATVNVIDPLRESSPPRAERLDDVTTAETGWVADPAAGEFRAVTPDRERLAELARQTGGRLVEPEDLNRFVASLSTRDIPITERWTYPLWHQAWVFALALACLAGEWGLRRSRGLP